MQFYLFPVFAASLLKKFEEKFQKNPDPDFAWYYYHNGKDHGVTEENFQILRSYFLKSIAWASVSLVLAILIGVYVYYQPAKFPGSIFNYLYLGFAVALYLKSVNIVTEGFYKPTELFFLTANGRSGPQKRIELKSQMRVWWESNKPVIQYFGIYFPGLTLSHRVVDGITPDDYLTVGICSAILVMVIVWTFAESFRADKKERLKQEDLLKKREGEREWEAYQRSLNEKINPVKTKKQKKKAMKKAGKKIAKKYKGLTTNL